MRKALESSHEAQWPRGGHISHVFLLCLTVSWPSFIESMHAFELSVFEAAWASDMIESQKCVYEINESFGLFSQW